MPLPDDEMEQQRAHYRAYAKEVERCGYQYLNGIEMLNLYKDDLAEQRYRFPVVPGSSQSGLSIEEQYKYYRSTAFFHLSNEYSEYEKNLLSEQMKEEGSQT